MTYYSKSDDDKEKPSGRRNHITGINTKEWHQETGSAKRTQEE